MDKNQQRQILKGFLQVTLGRLGRVRDDLSEQQQLFLDALPVLLHTNHPEFPCFVSEYTPSGICRYHPSGAEVQKLQKLVPGYTANAAEHNQENILGLYLAGDCGSIIESARQNMLIWVCYHPELGDNEVALLGRKCALIEQWADSLNLTVKFRVVDQHFISTQTSLQQGFLGQSFLELDRLYRSGILIAGRMPLWWLVPPEQEQDYSRYAQHLIENDLVNTEDVIDFGGIPSIPATQLIEISCQQLTMSRKTPFDICLKQLLTEIYISEYPETCILSQSFKQSIYDDNLDLDALDPYVMVYRRIEDYLVQRGEESRLELIRHCFYFSIGKPLSHYNSNPTWQQQVLESLVNEWGWSKEKLRDLDNRDNWKTRKVHVEYLQLIRELSQGYRFAAEFTRRHREQAHLSIQNIAQLGRQMYAAFERKAGKVDLIKLLSLNNLAEKNLYFLQMKHRLKTVWAVYDEPITHRDTPNITPLKRSESLLEVISWCHFNGLINARTKLDIINGEHQFTRDELQKILQTLDEKLPSPQQITEANTTSLQAIANTTHTLLFFNVGADPIKAIHEPLHSIRTTADTFDYKDSQNNKILNIECIHLNSWGEIICRRFEGPMALLNCISDYIQHTPRHTELVPKLNIECFCHEQGEYIRPAMAELFNGLRQSYFSPDANESTRFVLQMKQQFFLVQRQKNKVIIDNAKNMDQLKTLLSQSQPSFSPIVFDQQVNTDELLPEIFQRMSARHCNLFLVPDQTSTQIHITDSSGAYLSFTQKRTDYKQLAIELLTFGQAVKFRQSMCITDTTEHNYTIELFMVDTQTTPLTIAPLKIDELPSSPPPALQVIATSQKQNTLLNIFYKDQIFTGKIDEKALFKRLKQSIDQGQRPTITDIDISGLNAPKNQQATNLIEHFILKQQLENQLAS